MTQIEIARKLAKDAGLDPKAADAIVQAVAEYTDTIAPVSRDYLDKRLAETDTRIVQMESTLIKWVVGTGVVVVLSIVGTAIAAVNFLAAHYKP
jgi:hypothetical protein